MTMRRAAVRAAVMLGIAALVALEPAAAFGQSLQISNLLDAQFGNTPFVVPEDRTDVYDQLLLDAAWPGLRVGGRFESDHNSENTYTYAKLTQRYADWTDEHLRLRVGNFYTILGRGLVHRSFELQGVVLDPAFLRSRYGFSRDVDGVLAEAALGPLAARAFSGTPNGGEFPPSGSSVGLEPYAGELSGGQITATAWRDVRAGAAYEKSSNAGAADLHIASGFLDLDPARIAGRSAIALPLYFEYAQRDRSFGDWWNFSRSDTVAHALYAGGNLIWGPLALAAEWKHYRDFRFGTNDPPSLVREHSAPLLNRGTHVLNAAREEGYQLEGSLASPTWGTLLVNASRAEGRLGAKPAVFLEHFLELRSPGGSERRWEGTAFLDQGQNQSAGIQERHVGGVSATLRLSRRLSITADLEHQRARRNADTFDDHYLSVQCARGGWGSATLVWERTTDPSEESPAAYLTPGITPRNFVLVAVQGPVGPHSSATVTIGEQRGGLACTSGTCYQVLPFKGAQLRLTTRL